MTIAIAFYVGCGLMMAVLCGTGNRATRWPWWAAALIGAAWPLGLWVHLHVSDSGSG